MTTKTANAPEIDPNADVTESPEGWDWETHAEGAPTNVIFDTIGDTFIGKKEGERHVEREPNAKGEDQSFDLYLFRGRDGEMYSINQSYALVEALGDVTDGTWVRIKYIKDIPTARNQSPMKDFKVDVRR